MLKSAFLGCGPRAYAHADAYRFVKEARMAAICDLDAKRLNDFGEKFSIAGRYSDIHAMLDKEKPDILHIVTPPPLRASLMQIAADHRVPGVTIEKPIALQGEDFREVSRFLNGSPTKFTVNHQLRYHPRVVELRKAVLGGEIGDVRFIHGTSGLNMAGQGTHITDLIFGFNRESPPVRVFGHVSGGSSLRGGHGAPAMAGAEILFENGVHGCIACGLHAPSLGKEYPNWAHKRIAVYGTKGFIHWTMHGWEKSVDGRHETGKHEYGAEDVLGQAGHTDALAEWIRDDTRPNGNRLETALREYQLILGIYASALRREAVELPFEPENDLLLNLRRALR
ncbi:MAG: Gfo/Idh/MocA family oxidoreductase [Planctomycetes bacterium]|nr:Gfo/Idh/MocA family oxidoreductase [Planctomycetota bacterium]